MNIKSVFNFIEKLELSSEKKLFIIEESAGQFDVDYRKQNGMRLNNERIASIAQNCLKCIVETSDSTNFSFDERLKVLEQLKTSIRLHANRIYKRKPQGAKAISFLGVRGSSEKKLRACVKRILKQQAEYELHNNYPPELLKAVALIMLKDPYIMLKDCYHKVLDSTNRNFPLEGMHFRDSCLAFIEELKAFNQREIVSNGKENLIDQLINELEATYDLEVFYSSKDWCDPAKSKKKIKDFIKQIKNLKSDPYKDFGRRDKVIILGGTKSHCIIYQIAKEKDSGFSFTIINTGEGSKLHGIRGFFREFLGRDIKYIGIKEEDFTPEFIEKLVSTNRYKSTNQVLKLINRHFEANKHIRRGKGRIHKLQKHGTCVSKSIASWLKGEMPLKTGREFKVFMTMRKLDAIKELNTNPDIYFESMAVSSCASLKLSGPEIKKLTCEMIKEGEKILKKRARKLALTKEGGAKFVN